jgi:hypothetical protein
MLHGPIQLDDMRWLVYPSPHGCRHNHHMLSGMYYVKHKCGNHANEDGGFGGEACFGDVMLWW